MKPFEALSVRSVEDALSAGASRPDVTYLAGGTTLVDLLALGVESPGLVVDIGTLPLDRIETLGGGGLRIGALARNSAIATNPAVLARYPALAQAVLAGASPQVRNMATAGGNLLQRTRCAYFRDPASACNMREAGAGCAAIGGVTHGHAVLGVSDRCIATHPGDMAVALLALDAVIRTRAAGGQERAIPIGDFYVAYGEDPRARWDLAAGELITAIDLPEDAWFARSAYVKSRTRASFEFALASAAVAVDVQDGVIRDVRITIGGVATKPWRSREAEQLLIGRRPDPASFRYAAVAALGGAQPQPDNAYKIVLAERAIEAALRRVLAEEVDA